MQSLQTVNEKIVDLYPYKFSVSETRDRPPVIVVAMRTLNSKDFESGDSSLIKSIFDDIGKWEAFVQSASVMVKELGISQPTGIDRNFQYSPNKYDFREDNTMDETLRRFYVHLNKGERYRREGLEMQPLTSVEIADGIDNVRKWRAFVQTLELLRALTP
jgi:hypothetical protein